MSGENITENITADIPPINYITRCPQCNAAVFVNGPLSVATVKEMRHQLLQHFLTHHPRTLPPIELCTNR